MPIVHAVVSRLIEAYPGTVRGIKDSSGDPESGKAFIAAFPDLAIFPGTEAIMLDLLQAGAAGCISASANVNGPGIRAVWDAHQAGRADAPALQQGTTAVRMVLQARPMIPTLKQILARRLSDPAWLALRPPLTPLAATEAADLEANLADLAFSLEAA